MFKSSLNGKFLNTTDLLKLTYDQLSHFARGERFLEVFDTAFGTQYNRTATTTLRSQWQVGDFSQLLTWMAIHRLLVLLNLK